MFLGQDVESLTVSVAALLEATRSLSKPPLGGILQRLWKQGVLFQTLPCGVSA